MLIAMLLTVAVKDRATAFVLSHAAQLIVQVATDLLSLSNGATFIVQGVVAQVLIAEASVV